MKRSRLRRKVVKRGHILFSRFIFVYRKGLKKPVKFVSKEEFINQVAPKIAKHNRLSLEEAKRRVNLSFWTAPDAITEILKSADPTITGWQIPSKMVWLKKK